MSSDWDRCRKCGCTRGEHHGDKEGTLGDVANACPRVSSWGRPKPFPRTPRAVLHAPDGSEALRRAEAVWHKRIAAYWSKRTTFDPV